MTELDAQGPKHAQPGRVHFSGIGGTAMAAGARLALEAGWEVRGSDQALYPPASEMVRDLGIPFLEGYHAAHLDWNPDSVVIGNALSRGNPEVEAALERRLRYVSLPEWIKEAILRRRRPVVVTGTHGKTTTTALTAHVLTHCGLDPGYLIGGQPLDFPHPARLGPEGAPFVIEGDEYDTAFFDKRAKFFHYLPEIAIVTSVEFDHGDIYPDLASIERAFQLMLRQIPRNGRLILCADDPGAMRLQPHAFCPVTTYGFNEDAGVQGEITGTSEGLHSLIVRVGGKVWARVRTPVTGMHNLRNALAALAVAHCLDCEPDAAAEALRCFKGVKRRMEVFHEAEGAVFLDDFAHHPTALRATVEAVHARWPDRRLWVLFEPRSNTSVTNRFQHAFEGAFEGASRVWIGPIHRPDSIAPDQRLDRAALADALQAKGLEAHFTDDVSEIVAVLRSELAPGDVVLICSNGAFGGIYQRIKEAFASS